MMVVDRDETTCDATIEKGKVVGMATSRDLLRILNKGFKEGVPDEDILNRKVGDYMTPITQVIYARPEETVGTCRSIMAKLGVKCLPILRQGRVEGLITSRDMSEFGLDAVDRGGKRHYLESVSERVGLSSNTSMAEPPAYLRSHLAQQKVPLFTNVAMAELPHPFKTREGCGMSHRDFGPNEFADNVDLSEDASFMTEVTLPDEAGQEMRDVTYVGVADGVGSWREYKGVDPREFSHKLMQECGNILKEAGTNSGKKLDKGDETFRRLVTPSEVMAQAYERVKADNIIGSCTACVAFFDGLRHQLHFSNLGDSGLIVLRHIDSDVAGALKRDKKTPRTERTSDLRVAFVSQQQLRSFNHPFQLGWTGEEIEDQEETSFRDARESCSTSIHVRRGDIIIIATDGLFDNVELEDITTIALEWEQKTGFISGGDIAAREKRWAKGSSMTNESAKEVELLAKTLVEKARQNSLDKKTDSPFAILAKENDIMWSGGKWFYHSSSIW
jgi:protein phosphatase PTC7